ncbi:hypothetical protein [Paenibacillus sp. FSL W7-1287]
MSNGVFGAPLNHLYARTFLRQEVALEMVSSAVVVVSVPMGIES